MRMFVAITLPDSVKQHARMFRNDLGSARADIKWVEYQNYHLTLKFLGEVQQADLPDIRQALRQVAETCPAVNLSAGGIGFFPNRVRPRVIWMGIKGEEEKVEFLGERLDSHLSSLGFEEEKEHQLHLTLGRIRSDNKIAELLQIVDEIVPKNKMSTFKVDKFHLMQSDLTPHGPIYMVVDTYILNG